MKTSLNSKVLILSLSALVLAGTGCERRGKAPVKPTTATGGGTAVAKPGDQPKPAVSPAPSSSPAPKTTTSDKKPDISQDEILLETDARMVCDAKRIDILGRISPEAFEADLTEIAKFRECMTKSGIVLQENKETNSWRVDSTPFVKGEPMAKQSAALKEFSKIAHEPNSNDDVAYKVMGSRLELSIFRLSALKAKYTADNLKSAGMTDTQSIWYKLGQKNVTISATLARVDLGLAALEAAKPDFVKLEIFTQDGTDLSAPPATDTDSDVDAT